MDCVTIISFPVETLCTNLSVLLQNSYCWFRKSKSFLSDTALQFPNKPSDMLYGIRAWIQLQCLGSNYCSHHNMFFSCHNHTGYFRAWKSCGITVDPPDYRDRFPWREFGFTYLKLIFIKYLLCRYTWDCLRADLRRSRKRRFISCPSQEVPGQFTVSPSSPTVDTL